MIYRDGFLLKSERQGEAAKLLDGPKEKYPSDLVKAIQSMAHSLILIESHLDDIVDSLATNL